MKALLRLSVLVALLMAADGAFACSCPTSSLRIDLGYAQDVFVGIVEKIERGVDSGQKTTLSVVKSIKGIAHDHYEVSTVSKDTDCIGFTKGLTYIVFARDGGGAHVTTLCDGTRLLGCYFDPEVAELTGISPADLVYDENYRCVTPPLLVGDREPEFETGETFDASLVVDVEGNVADFRFAPGPCPPGCLARRKAIEGIVRHWRFIPAMANEHPVAYRFHELSRSRIQTTTEMEAWNRNRAEAEKAAPHVER